MPLARATRWNALGAEADHLSPGAWVWKLCSGQPVTFCALFSFPDPQLPLCSMGVIRPLLHKTIIGIKINLHKAIAARLLFAISRTKERVGVLPGVTQLSGKKKNKDKLNFPAS